MLSTTIETKLNEHMNAEFFSAHLYLSMTSYFRSIDLMGFAKWMQVQYEEELTHARRFFDFIDRREGRTRLTAITQPPREWDSPLAAFEYTFQHEQEVTKRIHELVNLSISEKDHPTTGFLQWFVTEQVEEETSVKIIMKKLKFVGNEKISLLMIDRELGQRGSGSDSGG